MATPIITDDPSVFSALTTLERQALVRPANPPPGIAGYLFDIPTDDDVELTAEVTDHFVGDNTAINDQVALRPDILTLRGVVAEVTRLSPTSQSISGAPDALPDNDAMEPELTPGAAQEQQIQNDTAANASNVVKSSQSLFDYYAERSAARPNETKQAKIFGYFQQLFRGRQLFTVETPWGVWTGMVILSIRAGQGETTKYQSDFTIVFKKIRTAQPVTVNVGQLAGRLFDQASTVTQNGTAGTKEVSPAERQSLLYRMTHPSP